MTGPGPTTQVHLNLRWDEVAVIDELSMRQPVPDTGRRAAAARILIRYGLAHLAEAEAAAREEESS